MSPLEKLGSGFRVPVPLDRKFVRRAVQWTAKNYVAKAHVGSADQGLASLRRMNSATQSEQVPDLLDLFLRYQRNTSGVCGAVLADPNAHVSDSRVAVGRPSEYVHRRRSSPSDTAKQDSIDLSSLRTPTSYGRQRKCHKVRESR